MQMRKWKQGLIALVVFFVAAPLTYITGNPTVSIIAVVILLFSMAYMIFLVVFFLIQRWAEKGKGKPMMEERIVKTKITTMYECGHCKTQYTNSQTCPQCGSPYRRTIDEKTEEEVVEKWKT